MAVTTPQSATKRSRPFKFCTLWVHEESFSRADVIFNASKFAECAIEPGSLARIVATQPTTSVRDFSNTGGPTSEDEPSTQRYEGASGRSKSRLDIFQGVDELFYDENGVKVEDSRRLDLDRYYVFMAKDTSAEIKSKSPMLQISLSSNVANVFGFRRGMQVAVSAAEESSHTASHVEISFRDEYLARADMWRLALGALGKRTVHKGQKLLFMGTIKATITNIYVRGEKVRCAFFSGSSKPVFRSESAKYIIFIQMSREMWDFDADGSGDLMFNRVINGFLPDLFKRWARIRARHLVSIILFTRVQYSAQTARLGSLPNFRKDERTTKNSTQFQDYYRVVTMEMESKDWLRILTILKTAFKEFLKEVSTLTVTQENEGESTDTGPGDRPHKTILAGEPTSAMRGNILEAINMASSQSSKDYIDRDLVRTGISVVIITPGTGVYEVSYDMLKLTTETLVGNGIGIDLVCLSRMPLHSVPLFKYRTPAILSALTSNQTAQTSFDADSTPRQSDGPLSGLVPRHVHGSPSRHSVLSSSPHGNLGSNSRTGPSVPAGSWSYALPHWIDVSFWTGSTDQDPLSERGPDLNYERKMYHFQQNGHTSFIARCRMYELQNMGVMESEMSNISIPYLLTEAAEASTNSRESKDIQKSHLASHSTKEQSAARDAQSEASAVEVDLGSKQRRKKSPRPSKFKEPSNSQWMDHYDENVFRTPEQQKRFYATYPRSPTTKTASPTELATNLHSNEVQGKDGQSPAGLHGTNKVAQVEVPRNSPAKEDSMSLRKASVASIGTIQRPSLLSRQISLGPKGIGLERASPSTSLTIDPRNVDRIPTIAQGVATAVPPSPRTPISLRQLQASLTLSREPSRTIARSTETPQKRVNEKVSKLISIRSSQGETNSLNPITTTKASDPSSPVKVRASTEGMGAIQAVSAANRIKPRIALSTSGGEREIPSTLSPISAMSPWLTLLNPSNPRKENMSIASQFRRWQHVFPRPIRTSAMKWKSLCSPAAVPLTNENFPTLHQLSTEYRENPYKISQNEDDEFFEIPRSRQALMRELIAFRLSHGFQLVVGAQAIAAAGRPLSETVNIFDKDFMVADGSTVFMSLGNTIHQLVCAADGDEVEVKRFQRKPTTAVAPSAHSQQGWLYKPLIRTMIAQDYEPRQLSLKQPEHELNWNYVDNFLAGYHDDFSDLLRFWRARFVLIPADIPSRRPLLPLASEDTDEEIRIEGIRKLTQLWQKNRFVSHEERRYQAPLPNTKDTNPLAIEYQTRDPSAVVAAGVENALLIESDVAGEEIQLPSEQESYHQSGVDLQKLAHDIQSERGIPVMDRRWHLRLHCNCFVGADLVSWLLQHFKDVQTRNEAVELGNALMQRGLFQHVQQKHNFRDGNFFFQIASEYRRRESRASWFGGRRTVPSTPSVESTRASPFGDHGRLKTPADDSPSGSGNKTPISGSGPKPKVALSRVLRFDVDHRKRSYRPEIINLHYDRLHNPDNCYHVRIDWMNVTPKLIEDTIVTWATVAERYGLKFVELPIAEACRVSETHLFRSPLIIKPVLQPPEAPPLQFIESSSFTPHGKPERFAYHKALLKHLGYVLDMESKDSFPADVNVTYSWGKPDYQLTQFIHRSGVVLAQVTEDGNFLLLGNRLCHNRAATTKEHGMYDKMDSADRRPPTASYGADRGSPFSSPPVRAIPDHASPALTSKRYPKISLGLAESIKDELESFCHSSPKLRAFYAEAFRPNASPSPGITPALEAAIPSLGLPPSIIVRDNAFSSEKRTAVSTDSPNGTSDEKDI
ncbi:MAG: vacuolar membrane-associated protein iml1 [Bathelium mastoideum]|nr:MAG: vacuolar membrane-associated protein iml1 [Bathelium mastoideum]